MVMKDLCEKIKWEQTRTLETGQVVTTGCEGKTRNHESYNMTFVEIILSKIF